MTQPTPQDQTARMITGYWVSQTGYWVSQMVYAAAKLGIADLLAGRPGPVSRDEGPPV